MKQYLKKPMIWLKRIFKGLVYYFAFIGFLPFLVVFIGIMSSDEVTPKTESLENYYLSMNLNGPVLESSSSSLESIVEELSTGSSDAIYLPKLLATLEHAANDPKLKAIVLSIGQIQGSYASVGEVRKAFEDFAQSGKPIYSFLRFGSEQSYYLSTISTEITAIPATEIVTVGPVFQLAYFSSAFEKLGIGFDLPRAGKYKSAIEPFFRNSPSEAALENYTALEASLKETLIQDVATGRKKNIEQVKNWFFQGVFSIDDALSQGMVDNIGYFDRVVSRVKSQFPDLSLTSLTYDQYRESVFSGESQPNEGVAVIELTGEITDAKDMDDITPYGAIKEINWARDNEGVKSVVIKVSSPGGSMRAADEIWREIEQLSKAKPVVVSMGTYAASGGYYISAPAAKIFANPSTITGSIGVYSMIANGVGLNEKWGVSFHLVSTSDRRDLMDFGKRASSRDLTLLETLTNNAYNTFLSRVAVGRKLTPTEVDMIGQGRVYTGKEAKLNGLVDELGGFKEALLKAGELVGYGSDKLPPMMRYSKSFSAKECIRSIVECASTISEQRSKLATIKNVLFKDSEGGFVHPQIEKAKTHLGKHLDLSSRGYQHKSMAFWSGYLWYK
jgi:protease-4